MAVYTLTATANRLEKYYEQLKDVDKAAAAFQADWLKEFQETGRPGNPDLSFAVQHGSNVAQWRTTRLDRNTKEAQAQEAQRQAQAGLEAAQRQAQELAAQREQEAAQTAELARQREAAAEAARAQAIFNANNQQLDATNLRSNDPEVNAAISTSTGTAGGTGLADRVLGGSASVQAQNTAASPVSDPKRRRRGLSSSMGINI